MRVIGNLLLILNGIAFAGALPLALPACDTQGGLSTAENIRRASEYREKGELRAAVIELKNVLQKEPDHAEARYLLGETYVTLGDGPAAEKELRRALELGREGVDVALAITRALLMQGQHQRALDQLAAIRVPEDNRDFLVLRGYAELGLQEVDKATATFEKALAGTGENVEARRGLARVALRRQQFKEADSHLEAALSASAGDPESLVLKGRLELSRRNWKAARTAFEAALKTDDHNAPARTGLIQALVAQTETEEADKHVQVLAKIHKDAPVVHYLSALVARQKGDLEATKDNLREVLRITPSHAPSLLLMGSIQFTEKKPEQAFEYLGRYLAVEPTSVPARKLLAAIQMQRGQPREAIKTLSLAEERAPRDAQLLAMLGSAHLSNRDFAEATTYLKKAADLAPDLAAIRTQLGLSHLANGASAKAVAALESAVEMDEHATSADYLLVLTHLRNKDFHKALIAAQTLSKKQPENPVVYNLMAGAMEGKGEVQKARELYEKALRLQPEYWTATLNLARLDLRGGNVNSAQARYESVLERDENSVSALSALAKLKEAQGKVEESARLLERARAGNPGAIRPRLLLVRYYLRTGKPQEALSLAEEAYKIRPDLPDVMLSLGQAQLANNRPRAALATFEKLTGGYPESAEAAFGLGVAQHQLGDPGAARRAFEKALRIDSTFDRAQLALGNLELRAGNINDALKLAREVQTKQPDSGAAYVLEGDAHMAAGNAPKAIQAYESALEKNASTVVAIKLFRAKRRVGDTSRAYQTLDSWLKDHPEDQAARSVLGSAYQEDHRVEDAKNEYERILRDSPENAVAMNNLAWIYHKQGDERSLSLAQEAHNRLPGRPEVMDTYGWLLVQNGKTDEGLKILEDASAKAPNIGDIRYHYAVALEKTGQTAAARTVLQVLLQTKGDFAERDNAQALLERLR